MLLLAGLFFSRLGSKVSILASGNLLDVRCLDFTLSGSKLQLVGEHYIMYVSSALPWLQKMMIFSLGMERSQQSMYPHGWRGAAGSALLYIYM